MLAPPCDRPGRGRGRASTNKRQPPSDLHARRQLAGLRSRRGRRYRCGHWSNAWVKLTHPRRATATSGAFLPRSPPKSAAPRPSSTDPQPEAGDRRGETIPHHDVRRLAAVHRVRRLLVSLPAPNGPDASRQRRSGSAAQGCRDAPTGRRLLWVRWSYATLLCQRRCAPARTCRAGVCPRAGATLAALRGPTGVVRTGARGVTGWSARPRTPAGPRLDRHLATTRAAHRSRDDGHRDPAGGALGDSARGQSRAVQPRFGA
jgi:hypothetical protein